MIPRGHGAKECLIATHTNGGQPRIPERVKKFRSLTHPEPGQARMLRSPTEDPSADEDVCHGVKTKSSLEVHIVIIGFLMHIVFPDSLKNRQQTVLYQIGVTKGSEFGGSHSYP